MIDDLIEARLKVENGDILVPEGPGLGIEVDWSTVEWFKVSA